MGRACRERGERSVLIFGMPRSGTTWVGKIFDSHPATLYKHEPDSWIRLTNVPILPTAEHFERFVPDIQRYHATIMNVRSAKVCAKTPIFDKAYLRDAQRRLLGIGIPLSRAAAKLGVEISVLGTPGELPDGARLVWKSIESIGRLRLIVHALPAASAIHLMRHPCGYIASVLRGESRRQFEDNRGAAEDYGILEMLLNATVARERKLSMDFFRELTPVERLAWRWVLFNDEAGRASQVREGCRSVRYEDICADPIGTVKELFSFTGLQWAGQTESFLKASTTHEQGSYYRVFKDSQLAVNRWRGELEPDAIELIHNVVRDTVPGQVYADDW